MSNTDLHQVIEALLSGHISPEDLQLLQQAFTKGEVTFSPGSALSFISASGSDSMAAGRDIIQNLHVHVPAELLQTLSDRLFPVLPGVPPPLPQLIFVGREGTMAEIKERLGIPDGVPRRQLILRGWPGIGKTTLVGVLGRDPDIKAAYPDGVLWVAVNEKPSLVDVFARWGRELSYPRLATSSTLDEAFEVMQQYLRGKKMLIIADDIWEAESAVPFLKLAAEDCSIVITTRLTQVAEMVDPGRENTLPLPLLDEEDSLHLLKILAPQVVQLLPDECRQLVRDVERLPLALQVAGRLLNSEFTRGFDPAELIQEIREGASLLQASAPIDRYEIQYEQGQIPTVQALLRKSTDRLDEESRLVFACLGAFQEKPASFSLDAMRSVCGVNDAKRFANILIDHGLLEPVGNARFQMHALLKKHADSMLSKLPPISE